MNVEEILAVLLTPTSQVALIMALAQLVKELGVPSKFIPVIDVVLGVLSGVCVYGLLGKMGIAYGIILGVALGLSACGLFSGIKNIKEALK